MACPSSVGMVPVKAVPGTWKMTKSVNNPSSDGILFARTKLSNHNCQDWSGPDCVHKDLRQCACFSTRDCTVCQLVLEVWRQAHDGSDFYPFLDSAAPLDTPEWER
jgi:hypothetical protein